MNIATAQSAASIQYAEQLCAPFFGAQEGRPVLPDPYVIRLSNERPEEMIRTPSFVAPRWVASPSVSPTEEVLDWDFAFRSPERPSGYVAVNLQFGGRGVPFFAEETVD